MMEHASSSPQAGCCTLDIPNFGPCEFRDLD